MMPGAPRMLEAADLAAFRALRLDALTQSPTSFLSSAAEEREVSDEEVLRRLTGARPSAVFGVHAGEMLVGMACFAMNDRHKQIHRGLLWGVYVRPDWRGRGIARLVVEAVIRQARAHVELLDATVTAANHAARALYRSLGFREYGLIERSLLIDGVYHDDVMIVLDFKAESGV